MKKGLLGFGFLFCVTIGATSVRADVDTMDLSKRLLCQQEVQDKRVEYTFYDDQNGSWSNSNQSQQPTQSKSAVLMAVRVVSEAKGKLLVKSYVGRWLVQLKDPKDPFSEKVLGFVSNDKQVKLAISDTSLKRKPSKIQIKNSDPMDLACYWTSLWQ